MTARFLLARAHIDRLTFDVHLDITKTIPDPADQTGQATLPDPRWVLHREWPLPSGWAARAAAEKAAIIAGIRSELIAAAQAQAALLQDQDSGGVALAIEGQTF